MAVYILRHLSDGQRPETAAARRAHDGGDGRQEKLEGAATHAGSVSAAIWPLAEGYGQAHHESSLRVPAFSAESTSSGLVGPLLLGYTSCQSSPLVLCYLLRI